MAQTHQSASKHSLQLSTLLLVLIGMFSAASPQSFKAAHLHHRSPTSSSRTSRHLNRSRASGGSRTSAESEIEPELSAALKAAPPEHAPLAVLVPAIQTFVTSMAAAPCTPQQDPAIASLDAPLPHLGRAPPLV